MRLSSSRPHERFYFSDGSLYLLVENTLYRVHRYLFETHASNFPLGPPSKETSVDATPHVIMNVKQIDFDRLLVCLYPCTLWVEENQTREEWTSVLNLASKWGFASLQARAITKIVEIATSPVDQVVLGRQYGISDLLMHGYATLCQSCLPISCEDGEQLGMKDVINIYRLRYELYGSDFTPTSSEEALEKVRAYVSAESCKDVAGTNQVSDEQTCIAPSHTPGNISDTESGIIVASNDLTSPEMILSSPLSDAEESDSQTPGPVPEAAQVDATAELAIEDPGPELLDKLTMENFGQISDQIILWVNNTMDEKILNMVTRLLVKKAVEEPGQSDICVRLCKEMMKRASGKVQDSIIRDSKLRPGVFSGGALFREYLGEICRENLEHVSTMAAGSDDRQAADLRRLRLIEFIGGLSKLMVVAMLSKAVVDKWVTALLGGVLNEEKIVTLCLLLTRAGSVWDTTPALHKRVNAYILRISAIAQDLSINHRARTLLLDVIELRNRGWVSDSTCN